MLLRAQRDTDLDETDQAAQRLGSLGLVRSLTGWVPSVPEGAADVLGPSATGPSAAPHGGPTGGRAAIDDAASITDCADAARPVGLSPVDPTSTDPTELVRAWIVDRLPPWAQRRCERFGAALLGWLLAAFASLVVVLLVVAHHHSGAGALPTAPVGGVATDAPSGSSRSQPVGQAAGAGAADAGSIVVDVGGRVRRPGLVTLPPGARVADAIAAAGGPLRRREVARVDLAARVSDGQLLLIGVRQPTGTTSAPDGSSGPASTGDGASGSGQPVDLNTATVDELEALPGVGPVTAAQIVSWRTTHNGFTSVEQLQQVTGIGPAKYAEISPLVAP
jgi:competence protein ComEA